MSLFGTNQPSTSSFGNLGSNTTTPQLANPFAKTASSLFPANTGNTSFQQSANSLFSNLNSSQNQQPVGSGLAPGATTQASHPQQQSVGSNLFGNHETQQKHQQQLPSSGSLFGGNTTQNQQSNVLASTQGTQPYSSTAFGLGQQSQIAPKSSSSTALFQNLLERGKTRQSESKSDLKFDELPSIKLGLSDIADKVRSLGGVPTAPGLPVVMNSRAHYLLAASGVPRASTLRDLDDFAMQGNASSTMPATPSLDTDIDIYINGLQAKSSAELFKDYMVQTKRDFDAFVEDRFQLDQSEQRQRIYQHFGLSRPDVQNGTSRAGTSVQTGRGAFVKSTNRTAASLRQSSSSGSFLVGAQSMSRSVLGKPMGKGSLRSNAFSDITERGITNTPLALSDDPLFRAKQDKYANKVRELNQARLEERVYPVIEKFAQVEIDSGEDTPQHLTDAYRALKRITAEDSAAQTPTDPTAIRERQFAKDYLDQSDTVKGLQMRNRILAGAKAQLEDSFFASIESTVARNPREAHLGGIPSKVNKVRAYIRVRALRKDLGTVDDVLQKIDDDFCWVLIYFLLRAGLVQEAAQYVADHERPLRSMDRGFPAYMSAYAGEPDRRLSSQIELKMDQEYTTRVQNSPDKSIDPYRMACYKIMGRCGLEQKSLPGVSTGVEDWMWVVLSLVREVPRAEESAGRSFNLEDVRTLVDQIGQRHFQGAEVTTGGYATFFFLQVLVGMFEKAVAWLQPYNDIAAVHFAIALDFYGLLRVSDFSPTETRLLTESTTQQPQISFGRLVGVYTQDFRLARAAQACDYLTLICLNADLPGATGMAHLSTCHEALKDLVLETREFSVLLGDIRADGRRIPGAIEQRLKLVGATNEADFLRSLTVQAAAIADDSGRTTDAVLLYHLAEEYDNVIVVINRALSDAISVELGRQHLRLQSPKPETNPSTQQQQQSASSMSLTSVDEPAVLARNMISLYNVNAMYFRKIRQASRDACGILIRMSEAKAKVEAGRWAEALDMIATLELLPLRAKGNVSVIRSFAQAFSSLPHVVARNIGNLLIWTITCLGKQREAIKNSAFQAQRPVADELLLMAKDLMVFAGLIRYKLPPDVFEVLAVGAY